MRTEQELQAEKEKYAVYNALLFCATTIVVFGLPALLVGFGLSPF